MLRRYRLLAIAVIGVIPLACPAPDDGVNEGTQLATDVSSALATGDAQKLGSLFADDGALIAAESTGMVLRGREQIVAYYAANFPHLRVNLSLQQSELQLLSDGSAVQRGVIEGSLVRAVDSVRIEARGTFVHFLNRRSDGSWGVFRGIWGFEHASPAPPANEECTQCCCKTVSGCDCIVRPAGGCTNDFPVPVVKP